jgi:hypothetical protein
MPRALSAVLTLLKNDVVSDDPFLWLFSLESPDFPQPLRFVNDVQSLIYQGDTYYPFPVDITALQENSLGERQTLQGVAANVDRAIISLLNTYWDAVSDPNWTLKLWQVARIAPDEVPASHAEVYEVLSVDTDLLMCTFELSALGIPSRQRSTGRRYTTSGGYPYLPRVGRLFA